MRNKSISTALIGLAVTAFLSTPLQSLFATNLSLGAEYLARSVSTKERDMTIDNNSYVDNRLQAYLTTDLSKDVEASVRVQSITPWGLEGSTNPLTTRYPSANGNVWVQNAYVRLPNIWEKRVTLTVGRQPIQWGDGAILADDELGFNAIRLGVKSPFRWLPIDLDGFVSKITEGLREPGDTDLYGAVIGFDRSTVRWEIMGLLEKSDSAQPYQVGADTDTIPISINHLERQILGLRAKANLKDAYMKGEVYVQSGSVRETTVGAPEIKLGGMGYILGLGGKANNKYLGRFGAVVELCEGDGDDPKTTDKDESFRPTYASRWSGLERKGYGKYFAAGFTDAYSPEDPFGQATSVNDGMPVGTSGIQTIKVGLDSTPWAQWTFTIDFYRYKAQRNIAGVKDLGSEIDYGVDYRYSGLVSFKAYLATFHTGDAFDAATKRGASSGVVEVEVKF